MGYKEIIASGYMGANDYNCAEAMLNAANEAYDLGLDEKAVRVACPFGGGMGKEATCGALTGGLMVLGVLYATGHAHGDERLAAIRDRCVAEFEKRFTSIDCAPVKERFADPDNGCQPVVDGAARIIDELVKSQPK